MFLTENFLFFSWEKKKKCLFYFLLSFSIQEVKEN